ncbi:MAG TPA: hypothetical protein VF593_12870 [Chthoniobacteraceae bacterium]
MPPALLRAFLNVAGEAARRLAPNPISRSSCAPEISPSLKIEPLGSRIAPFGTTDGQSHAGRGADGNADAHQDVFGGKQLLGIRLANADALFGASIAISAKPQDANGGGFLDGDGLVNVGFIQATASAGINLGATKIAGDLGRIEAGGEDGENNTGVVSRLASVVVKGSAIATFGSTDPPSLPSKRSTLSRSKPAPPRNCCAGPLDRHLQAPRRRSRPPGRAAAPPSSTPPKSPKTEPP